MIVTQIHGKILAFTRQIKSTVLINEYEQGPSLIHHCEFRELTSTFARSLPTTVLPSFFTDLQVSICLRHLYCSSSTSSSRQIQLLDVGLRPIQDQSTTFLNI
ncbi:conserved hypothetical protein [Trichinella spiralis]|uniref:hypothetical protein n=1 Tax=Trichinella spiralis TaxID=6334 RepID=UPI0001EFD7AC|nr:conserved hypothetical protein [Trichinella spiralis]